MKEYDENDVVLEDRKAGKDTDFVNAAEAQIVLMNGMIEYLKKKQQELADITYNSEKFKFPAYADFKKSLDDCIKVLENNQSGYEKVAGAIDNLKEKSNDYMHDALSGNEGYFGPVTQAYFVVEDINKKSPIFNTAYLNTRVALAHTKGFGNTSIARVKAKKAGSRATKEYNFESMCMMAESQNKIRKTVKDISYTFNQNYSRNEKKDSYMFIKKNPKVSDLAKSFVLSEYLDKAYDTNIMLAGNVDDLKTIKRLENRSTYKKIKKEIDILSKNQLFIDCIMAKGKKAFSEWADIERKTDRFVDEYEETFRLMGGNDTDLLIEQIMGVRQLASDRLEEVLADKNSVKELGDKVYLFPDGGRNVDIMVVLANDYIQSVDDKLDDNGNVKPEVITNAKNQAMEEFMNIATSTYNNVGKIVALQILGDPKNRQLLNNMAMADKEPKAVFNDLSTQISEYLSGKGMFDFDLGAAGDKKCISNVKKVINDSKFKDVMLKEFKNKQIDMSKVFKGKQQDVNKVSSDAGNKSFDADKMKNIAKKVRSENAMGKR